MRSPKRLFKIIFLLALLSFACRFPDAISTSPAALPGSLSGISRAQILRVEGGESTNPNSYDPATSPGSGTFDLVFSGLVAFNPQLQLVPELAESWQVSEGGTVYTFTLRANARFQDGRQVTAQDFVYSWERAAAQTMASQTVLTYLGDIVGVREMRSGKASQIAGLKVLDERTLQVTIDAPKPYFLLKLTYPTAYVVDRANVESGEEWYRQPNGTGPYRLKEWKSFEYRLYERNEYYPLQQPAIPYILISQPAGGLLGYEAGASDIQGVGVYDLERVRDPKEPLNADLRSGVSLCTNYMTFDVTQPPFEDVKVRQALTMAFDREKFSEVVLRGAALPARGLYPPGLPGYTSELASLPYDPQRARELLGESKYESAANLPPIVFTQGGSGYYVGRAIAAIAQMWEQNLGIEITVQSLDGNRYYELLAAGYHGQILSDGWCADYPDPENFADALFHTGAEINRGNYSNPELDALLEQARIERDVAQRIAMYQQAEQIIVDDAPALFLSHSLDNVLVKPYIQGYVLTPLNVPMEKYLTIDESLVP